MIYYLQRLYKGFRGDVLAIPGRVIALVFGLLLFCFPLFTTDLYILRILIFACILAIYAASWDLLAGFTGQLSLGHGALFGVAAYAAGLLNFHLGLSPWLTIPVGAIIGMGAGLIIAIPALRLRGIYLALVTLAFPVILTGFVFGFSDFTGGELGISGIDPLASSRVSIYYITLLTMAVCLMIMWKLTDARSSLVRTGVLFHAIREDEITARASGINTILYKLLAFSISGFFAGIAGGLYVHFIRVAGPSTLELFFSIYPVIWTIFGGITTIYGPVAGVFILYPFTEFIRTITGAQTLIMAAVIILTLLFMPEGITVWVRDKMEETCPRCKLVNIATRRYCRACGAPLHLER